MLASLRLVHDDKWIGIRTGAENNPAKRTLANQNTEQLLHLLQEDTKSQMVVNSLALPMDMEVIVASC